MQGFMLTFFTLQDRRHRGKPVAEWLIEEVRRLGIRGATLTAAAEGFGHDHRFHAAHFFELADQPVKVTMAVAADEMERVFTRLREEKVHIFYVKSSVEFGTLCEP
jgi:uncharacterized protein